MPGLRIASTDGGGWTIETVELALTGRTHRRGGRAVPSGDGAQLLVQRHGFVIAYCAGPDDLAALGMDLSRMAVVARWLLAAQVQRSGVACCAMPDEPDDAPGTKPGERPLWVLSADEQRVLLITFAGGLASIIVGAAVIGASLALARSFRVQNGTDWRGMAFMAAAACTLTAVVLTRWCRAFFEPVPLVGIGLCSVILWSVLILWLVGVAAGIH